MYALFTNFSSSHHFLQMCGLLILSEQILSPALSHTQLVSRSCRSLPSSQSNHSLKSPSSAGLARSSQMASEMVRLARRALFPPKKASQSCSPIYAAILDQQNIALYTASGKPKFSLKVGHCSPGRSRTLLPSRLAEAAAAPTYAVWMRWQPELEGVFPMLSPTAKHIEWQVLKCKPDIFLGDFVRHITLLYYYRELSKQPSGKALPQTCRSINCHSIK